MAKELDKQYSPQNVEDRTYKFWCDHKYFHAEVNPEKKPYTIVIPPPNITGQLHMGHALDETLQDILIRWRRMEGYETLWLPGTDHASIATEAKIVEAMRKEGITKEEIGREKFLERAWEWKAQYGGRIVEQLKKLGSSCDWDRERFTLDEGCSKAVREVFCKLYDKGLIYRGERIINWCPHCLTSISDAEVEYEDQAGHFWHLRYPFKDGSGYLELATTRPETLLGDTAVAVNPNDERYKDMVGKTLILPIVHREIPVIADDYVDIEFGTGVVKITPAHDPNDFEVGLRHNLEVIISPRWTPTKRLPASSPRYAPNGIKNISSMPERQGDIWTGTAIRIAVDASCMSSRKMPDNMTRLPTCFGPREPACSSVRPLAVFLLLSWQTSSPCLLRIRLLQGK